MELYFQNLSDALMDGDLETVANYYTYPLVVYEPTGIQIHKTTEETTRKLAERLVSLRSGGAVSVRIRLDNTGPTSDKRQPFDVTKTYLDQHGRPVGQTRLRYFCQTYDGEMRVELIEISEGFRMDAFPKAPSAAH